MPRSPIDATRRRTLTLAGHPKPDVKIAIRRRAKVGATPVAFAMAALRHRSTADVPDMRMTSMTSVRLLPDHPYVDSSLVDRVRRDYERLARGHWPHPIEEYLADEYALDVSTDYAGLPLRNPWGKASGQLSMTAAQVAEDVEAGLGFVVLKTVIAQDSAANQSMQEWAIRESRMSVERIVGRSGEPGWTTTWKGRGWWQPFDDYLNLVREARRLARASRTLIVPSCKFHLPAGSGEEWRMEEYDFTVNKLLEAWQSDDKLAVMPLEKDFSPTLAGSDRARQRGTILSWLRSVPRLIRAAAKKSGAGSAGGSARAPSSAYVTAQHRRSTPGKRKPQCLRRGAEGQAP